MIKKYKNLKGWVDFKHRCPRCDHQIQPYHRKCEKCGLLVKSDKHGRVGKRLRINTTPKNLR